MKKQYIKSSNEAPSLRLTSYLVWYLALDHFNAPEWLWGLIGALLLLIFIGTIVRFSTEDGVDVVKR